MHIVIATSVPRVLEPSILWIVPWVLEPYITYD
nr:MAG TPA: hypothetical protein [Caudoviricetes sp.]